MGVNQGAQRGVRRLYDLGARLGFELANVQCNQAGGQVGSFGLRLYAAPLDAAGDIGSHQVDAPLAGLNGAKTCIEQVFADFDAGLRGRVDGGGN